MLLFLSLVISSKLNFQAPMELLWQEAPAWKSASTCGLFWLERHLLNLAGEPDIYSITISLYQALCHHFNPLSTDVFNQRFQKNPIIWENWDEKSFSQLILFFLLFYLLWKIYIKFMKKVWKKGDLLIYFHFLIPNPSSLVDASTHED